MNQLATTNPLKAELQSSAFLAKLSAAAPETMRRVLTPDRLVRAVLGTVARTPRLAECTHQSIMLAMIEATALGLDCSGGVLGHAYLVPYKKNWKDDRGRWHSEYRATLIPGYRGLITLAMRSGEVHTVEARVVREKDHFDLVYGTNPSIEHRPALVADPGAIVAVYGIARLRSGAQQADVMTIAEVEAVRARSRSKDSGPWVTDYAEMVRKTVVRRLCKYVPMSPDLVIAMSWDDAADRGDDTMLPGYEVPALPPKDAAQDLADRLPDVTPAADKLPSVVLHEAAGPDYDWEDAMADAIQRHGRAVVEMALAALVDEPEPDKWLPAEVALVTAGLELLIDVDTPPAPDHLDVWVDLVCARADERVA
jgi:recombination protein RecT